MTRDILCCWARCGGVVRNVKTGGTAPSPGPCNTGMTAGARLPSGARGKFGKIQSLRAVRQRWFAANAGRRDASTCPQNALRRAVHRRFAPFPGFPEGRRRNRRGSSRMTTPAVPWARIGSQSMLCSWCWDCGALRNLLPPRPDIYKLFCPQTEEGEPQPALKGYRRVGWSGAPPRLPVFTSEIRPWFQPRSAAMSCCISPAARRRLTSRKTSGL